jgi:hypothetical protein
MKAFSVFYLLASVLPGLGVLGFLGVIHFEFLTISGAVILSIVLTAVGIVSGIQSKRPSSAAFWIGTAFSAIPGLFFLAFVLTRTLP